MAMHPNMSDGSQPPRIEPDAYTEEYFLTSVEGHAQFDSSGGTEISARLVRALQLARTKPGQRVLDIACGRGEVVLQAALRGAHALGIDYAQAAMSIARNSLDGHDASRNCALARMDATNLALKPHTFDIALMLDFVEHVYQHQLEAAFAQIRQALEPGGRLIIHTSPNRVFEETVYPRYVRNVHRIVLNSARRVGLKGRFFNPLILPTDPVPPHSEYERELHVNPQSARSLQDALQRQGFRIRLVAFWEPPQAPFFDPRLRWHNFMLSVLNAVSYVRPLSRFPPLNRLFSNHIWVVAESP